MQATKKVSFEGAELERNDGNEEDLIVIEGKYNFGDMPHNHSMVESGEQSSKSSQSYYSHSVRDIDKVIGKSKDQILSH